MEKIMKIEKIQSLKKLRNRRNRFMHYYIDLNIKKKTSIHNI